MSHAESILRKLIEGKEWISLRRFADRPDLTPDFGLETEGWIQITDEEAEYLMKNFSIEDSD